MSLFCFSFISARAARIELRDQMQLRKSRSCRKQQEFSKMLADYKVVIEPRLTFPNIIDSLQAHWNMSVTKKKSHGLLGGVCNESLFY